jgi:phosphate transport system protein
MHIQTRTVLDREISKMQADIVRISSMVEGAIEQALAALEERSIEKAQIVIAGDHQINILRYEVEEDALLTLATQNPRAGDLRLVIAAIHIAVELERMGDHAVGIAKLVERMRELPNIDSLHQLPKMANRANKMVRLAIDAFISQDLEAARELMDRDQKVNRGYEKLFTNTLADMNTMEDYSEVATYLLWMGHNIERIGDRAVNIAERVVFMITGNLSESLTTDFDTI